MKGRLMFGFGIGNRQSAKKQQARFRLYKPLVDVLESRTLLAWTPIGPLTQTGWPVPNSIFAEPVAGRVTSLAYSTNFDGQNHNEIIMGTAGGGIWIWAEGQNPLNWRPITETFTDFAMPS